MTVPVVVVDEGRPDGDRRPASGGWPVPGRSWPGSAPPARWVDDGAGLAITTHGSSSAPTVPTALHVDGQRLAIDLAVRDPGGGVMSADLSPYVTVIETPAGLDPTAPVVLVVGGIEYRLPPAPEQPDEPVIELRPAGPPPGP